MSTDRPTVRVSRTTVPGFLSRKGGDPIVCLTAYTAPMAGLLDPHVDMLLVGDSLGMVVYGFPTTLPVTLEMMIAHGAAVVRGSRTALVTIDMPFGSYQASPADAYRAAARLLAETGAAAVKLEGGREMAETIRFLAARGIPVMGHIGLEPQQVHAVGGYRYQGRDLQAAQRLTDDALAIAEAGAFGLVIEATAEPVARAITERIAIPTIGIGASPACDGQILVAEDMLGLFPDFAPRFVHRFGAIAAEIDKAAAAYAAEVQARRFPAAEHCFMAGPARVAD